MLQGLPKLMTTVMRQVSDLSNPVGTSVNLSQDQGSRSLPDPNHDGFVLSMATEHMALCSGKRAITIVKSVLYLAYTIRAMFHEVSGMFFPAFLGDRYSNVRERFRRALYPSPEIWEAD